MCSAKQHVRFTPESDIKCDITERLLRANSGSGRNQILEYVPGKPWGCCRGAICRTKYSSALMGRGERVKSASPVTNMSSTLLGPVLPWYVVMPVQVICAARGDCSPRLIAKTWALFVVP